MPRGIRAHPWRTPTGNSWTACRAGACRSIRCPDASMTQPTRSVFRTAWRWSVPRSPTTSTASSTRSTHSTCRTGSVSSAGRRAGRRHGNSPPNRRSPDCKRSASRSDAPARSPRWRCWSRSMSAASRSRAPPCTTRTRSRARISALVTASGCSARATSSRKSSAWSRHQAMRRAHLPTSSRPSAPPAAAAPNGRPAKSSGVARAA